MQLINASGGQLKLALKFRAHCQSGRLASGEFRMRSAKRLKMFEPALRLPAELQSLVGVDWALLVATELLLPPKARRKRLVSLADGGGGGCTLAGRSHMQRNFSHSGHSSALSH